MKRIFAIFLFLLPLLGNAQAPFMVKPYIQIGYNGNVNSFELLWHTADTINNWKVIYSYNGKDSTTLTNFLIKKVNVKGVQPFFIYHATLTNLSPGIIVKYKVINGTSTVFESEAYTPKSKEQPYSFVSIGDIGAEKMDQKKLALLAYKLNPDFIAIPGDIVYDDGLISEYAKKFWPIYNSDSANNDGAPLMRKIPFIAAVGNHDVDNTDLDKHPDALAYYYFWAQPLNGPLVGDFASAYPSFKSNEVNKNAFLAAAGNAYPKMNHYSYDYGNAHWLVIDADNYVDWTNKELLNWVKEDLANASKSTWRFVMFHHPGFNSSREHFEQQQMRLLSPLFEEGKVDVVFTGHVHNYQRSFPLNFIPDRKGTQLVGGKDNKSLRGRVVNGKWTLDKTFDGAKNTKPKGVIYIVTGAGGADLYNPEQTNDMDSWQKFTHKFYALSHSLSYIQVNGNRFTMQQINSEGQTIDRFEIVK